MSWNLHKHWRSCRYKAGMDDPEVPSGEKTCAHESALEDAARTRWASFRLAPPAQATSMVERIGAAPQAGTTTHAEKHMPSGPRIGWLDEDVASPHLRLFAVWNNFLTFHKLNNTPMQKALCQITGKTYSKSFVSASMNQLQREVVPSQMLSNIRNHEAAFFEALPVPIDLDRRTRLLTAIDTVLALPRKTHGPSIPTNTASPDVNALFTCWKHVMSHAHIPSARIADAWTELSLSKQYRADNVNVAVSQLQSNKVSPLFRLIVSQPDAFFGMLDMAGRRPLSLDEKNELRDIMHAVEAERRNIDRSPLPVPKSTPVTLQTSNATHIAARWNAFRAAYGLRAEHIAQAYERTTGVEYEPYLIPRSDTFLAERSALTDYLTLFGEHPERFLYELKRDATFSPIATEAQWEADALALSKQLRQAVERTQGRHV